MITLPGVDPRMIANNLMPFEPTHPGEILKDEIEYRGLSQRDLAEQMGVSYATLNSILNSKHPVTAEYAMLFEAVLDVDAMPLISMQADYDYQIANRNKTFVSRLAKLREMSVVFQQPTFTTQKRVHPVTA